MAEGRGDARCEDGDRTGRTGVAALRGEGMLGPSSSSIRREFFSRSAASVRLRMRDLSSCERTCFIIARCVTLLTCCMLLSKPPIYNSCPVAKSDMTVTGNDLPPITMAYTNLIKTLSMLVIRVLLKPYTVVAVQLKLNLFRCIL